jgi:hypothetical protein
VEGGKEGEDSRDNFATIADCNFTFSRVDRDSFQVDYSVLLEYTKMPI